MSISKDFMEISDVYPVLKTYTAAEILTDIQERRNQALILNNKATIMSMETYHFLRLEHFQIVVGVLLFEYGKINDVIMSVDSGIVWVGFSIK